MKIDHAIIIGAGGTGSHLIEPLVRLLHYHEDGTKSITVIDGDQYEDSNSTRQLFSKELMGVNKAEAQGRKIDFAELRIVPEYVNDLKMRRVMNEIGAAEDDMILLILAVDNHATRSAVMKMLTSDEYQNFAVLSPGNDFSHGQVVCWARINGEDKTQHPFERYPLLEFPEDNIPGLGCAEEAVSTPQLIMANALAAVSTNLYVSNILDNKPIPDEIHFNVYSLKIVPSEGTEVILALETGETSEVLAG
tara:strand:- start:3547 stop:4293 length:747 start_codon:yes stop_codon:yes gene_type:complete